MAAQLTDKVRLAQGMRRNGTLGPRPERRGEEIKSTVDPLRAQEGVRGAFPKYDSHNKGLGESYI